MSSEADLPAADSPYARNLDIALLGGGRMGEALLAGWLRAGHRVRVAEKLAVRAQELAARYGVSVGTPVEVVAGADVVVVATKPHDVAAVLAEVAGAVSDEALVISVAAGVTIAALESALESGLQSARRGAEIAVVRCIPNTPALVGEGMTALAPSPTTGADKLRLAESLLAAVGHVVRVEESQLDAVTALSGSGPAYVFAVVEALVDGGVLLGLPRPLATHLVTQTLVGSAAMLRQTEQSAAHLREAVTSPGGTTAAALRQLDERGLRAALITAVEAAARRSRELGS